MNFLLVYYLGGGEGGWAGGGGVHGVPARLGGWDRTSPSRQMQIGALVRSVKFTIGPCKHVLCEPQQFHVRTIDRSASLGGGSAP